MPSHEIGGQSSDDRLQEPASRHSAALCLKQPERCGRHRASASPPAPASNPHNASSTAIAKPARDFVPGRFSDVGPSTPLTPPRRRPRNLHPTGLSAEAQHLCCDAADHDDQHLVRRSNLGFDRFEQRWQLAIQVLFRSQTRDGPEADMVCFDWARCYLSVHRRAVRGAKVAMPDALRIRN